MSAAMTDKMAPPGRPRRAAAPQPRFDSALAGSVAGLLALGTVMVYSATIAADSATLEMSSRHLLRHLLHIGLGAVLLLGAAAFPLERLQRVSQVGLLSGLLLLGAVLLFGVEVNGSRRWLELAGLRLQPSEFVKIAAVIYFADYLARKQDDLQRFRVGVLNLGLVAGVIGLLLLLEPDFGTAVVLAAAAAVMLFLAGIRLWHFLLSVGAAAALTALLAWLEPYRAARLLSYRDPWADPFGHGFQLVQALIAIGRGEWFGAGLGSSIQKLFYLPHAANDFLIAVIGEELGAAGIFTVLGLFMLLLFRTFAVARRALELGHRFPGLLAQGLGALLAIQAALHVGVNTGLLPTTGLTLPLMSYGGSSMLSSMAAIGLILAVDRHSRPARVLARNRR